ncbi:MAG: hypothetical protein C4B58_03575 [Deltaproteobacteria bacterium]|nr:MAG: hypothetical protein C4B58_03575 [Deltaproteobacteria bacterium]
MAKSISENTGFDDVARLTSDIADTDTPTLARLCGLCAEALRETPDAGAQNLLSRLAGLVVDEDMREAVRGAKLGAADLKSPPLRVVRQDERENLIEARIAGPLSALGGAERLGPFIVDGGSVWFEFYRAARHFEVSETGAIAPAFVMTSARRPTFASVGSLTLDLQPGTIWIRGDLFSAGLPAGAYVGITVNDGKLALPNTVSVGDDSVEVAAPLEASLTLKLKADAVSPKEGGCLSQASVVLPDLSLNFGPSGLVIEGGPGEASAWGRTFALKNSTGAVELIGTMWTLVLDYTFSPDHLDGAKIESQLTDFRGEAKVAKAGLGLPVVVAAPAILGPASVAPGWWLSLEKLQSRWYAPDERFHEMDAWMGIGTQGISLFSPSVAALSRPVTNIYRLWEIADDSGRRVPWRHSYDGPFLFFHRCDAINGEDLLTTGSAKVVLDRPVQTNGIPVRTPATLGVMHQRKATGDIRVTLAALVEETAENQLALRNALVWATRAVAVMAQGSLTDRTLVDEGTSHVFFGIFAWVPTLPDPYVGNFRLCRPDIDTSRALLVAKVAWKDTVEVVTSFSGNLGPPIVCDKPISPGQPVPAPQSDLVPDVGLTQTEQDRLYPDEEHAADRHVAQQREKRNRGKRAKRAEKQNQNARAAIDRYLEKVLGRTPPVLLLDVSTNQDLLGVAMWGAVAQDPRPSIAAAAPTGMTGVLPGILGFPVQALEVRSPIEALRLVTLPQIQWEPVRTLDADQDIVKLGWFPTPLASATDGGATVLGARSQSLAPAIPEDVLKGTRDAFADGKDVTFRTTLPFGLITVVQVNPVETAGRKADRYELTRPDFPDDNARGGLHITAHAEGGRSDEGGISPMFAGQTRQLINGVDLATGAPLGLSVLGSTGDPAGSVETVFNNDMSSDPKVVPVTRFDLSGYGGSNFSEWQNPFAAFAEASKVQFQVIVGRTALEIIKVTSVLHPWGIRVTRAITVERRTGGGVVRRDSGWQATTPGLLDYRYMDTDVTPPEIAVADYAFDAGVFKGLFNVRSIRPAPGVEFSDSGATFVPYYFDAELALDGLSGRTQAIGVLGWLQTAPNGEPASKAALEALIEAQGPVGGPIDAWLEFGASKLPFRARRIEVGLADDGGTPLFVATVRGVPKFPKTGAWSVVRRDLVGVPPGGGEAVPVSETRGVPMIRRYPVEYKAKDDTYYSTPPLKTGGIVGPWRFADAADLLTPTSPQNEYCVLQSTPTHAFLFPRPYAQASGATRVRSDVEPELADVIARSTSKGAFPPPENAIKLGTTYYFNVGFGGTLALSNPVSVVNHPHPLRLSGSLGHGAEMLYDDATLQLEINSNNWSAEFYGLRIWSDIAGMSRVSGAKLRIVGSTTQRPQVAEVDTLVQESIEKILTYLPIFGARETLGPIDLGASNAKHEIKVEVGINIEVPKNGWSVGGANLKLKLGTTQKTGFDLDTGGVKASAKLTAGFQGEFPIFSVAAASVYIIAKLDITFSIASVSGSVTTEKFELLAFVGVGVKGEIGPFKAYAFLGIGFVLSYDIVADLPKYGGLVRFEAGVSVAIVKVTLRADLQGLVYKKTEMLDSVPVEKTMCDYSGKVKLQVDIFLIISISATYSVSGTKELE